MEITEVRIKLMEDTDDRLQAFCSITLDDCFVVRDLKIIEGSNGPFVAMPSRKLTCHCGACGSKNHLRSNFCNQCGQEIRRGRDGTDHDGRTKLYADIAHPINSDCREMIQSRVIQELDEELKRARLPGYISRYDEDYDAGPETEGLTQRASLSGPHRRPNQAASRTSQATSDDSSGTSKSAGDSHQRPPQGGFGAGIFDE